MSYSVKISCNYAVKCETLRQITYFFHDEVALSDCGISLCD